MVQGVGDGGVLLSERGTEAVELVESARDLVALTIEVCDELVDLRERGPHGLLTATERLGDLEVNGLQILQRPAVEYGGQHPEHLLDVRQVGRRVVTDHRAVGERALRCDAVRRWAERDVLLTQQRGLLERGNGVGRQVHGLLHPHRDDGLVLVDVVLDARDVADGDVIDAHGGHRDEVLHVVEDSFDVEDGAVTAPAGQREGVRALEAAAGQQCDSCDRHGDEAREPAGHLRITASRSSSDFALVAVAVHSCGTLPPVSWHSVLAGPTGPPWLNTWPAASRVSSVFADES